MKSDQVVFLCSGVTNLKENKLSHRIADTPSGYRHWRNWNAQHAFHAAFPNTNLRKKMIFINDCNASCVKMLTHGFTSDDFIYIDVAQHKNSNEFNIDEFIQDELLPRYYDLIRHRNGIPEMETGSREGY